MVKPGSSSHFVGTYNPNGSKWTAFTQSDRGGWISSPYVKQQYISKPEYTLNIMKQGNNYHFYINQAYVYSHYINESEAKFAGIGFIQKGKAKGIMSAIGFVNDVKN